MDVPLALDQCLSSVAMMHVPVNDQDSLQPVHFPGVVRGNRHVAEQAEAHGAIMNRVVARRANRAEAPPMNASNRQIDAGQHAAHTGGRRKPGAATGDGVGVEPPSSLLGDYPDGRDVRWIVGKRELFNRGVSPLEVLDLVKKVRVLSQRARDGAQTADVLRMSPAGVVTPAIAV